MQNQKPYNGMDFKEWKIFKDEDTKTSMKWYQEELVDKF